MNARARLGRKVTEVTLGSVYQTMTKLRASYRVPVAIELGEVQHAELLKQCQAIAPGEGPINELWGLPIRLVPLPDHFRLVFA